MENKAITERYLEAVKRHAERRYGPPRREETEVEKVVIAPSVLSFLTGNGLFPSNEERSTAIPLEVSDLEVGDVGVDKTANSYELAECELGESVTEKLHRADQVLVSDYTPSDHYVTNWLGRKTHLSHVENLHGRDRWWQYLLQIPFLSVVNILDTIHEMLILIREYKECRDWSSLSMHCRTMCKLGYRSGVFKSLFYSIFLFSDTLNKKCSNVMSIQKDMDFPIEKVDEYCQERGKWVKLYDHEIARLVCVYDYVAFMKFCMELKKNDPDLPDLLTHSLQYKFILHQLEDCLQKERVYYKKLEFVRFVLFTFFTSLGALYIAGQFVFAIFTNQ